MTVHELFETIKSTAGSNSKKEVLKQNFTPVVKQIFLDTYDTTRKYYIKKIDYDFREGSFTIDNNYDTFHNMLDMLNNRDVTGNTALMIVKTTIDMFKKEDQDILIKILKRNLKIGISMDNFNSTMSDTTDTIKKFQVALANKIQDAKNIDMYNGSWFVSRKLDGVRCIVMYDGTDVKYISRQGKEFKTLSKLDNDIRIFFDSIIENTGGTWVLDGELCIVDENGDEHFDWVIKEINRKDHTIENPLYKIFDCLTYEEFIGEKESPRFSNRHKFLVNTYNNRIGTRPAKIQIVEQVKLLEPSDYEFMANKVDQFGWEGLMIRKDVPYKSGRSNDLLKIKKMQDAEYEVKDVLTGKVVYNEGGNKEFDAVTALIIEHKGNKVQVGSGLSKEQRLSWFNTPEKIIGKTITVQYFEETKNSKTGELSLRFPVLKTVYENKREY